MASPPVEVEDQTDEDFFDKLVADDDDFGIRDAGAVAVSGDDSVVSDTAEVFANLSIGSVAPVVEDVVVAPAEPPPPEKEEIAVGEKFWGNVGLPSEELHSGEAVLAAAGSSAFGDTGSVVLWDAKESAEVIDPVEKVAADTSLSKGGGSGGSSNFKEVDWSAFHADVDQQGENVFGSTDFFSQLSDISFQEPNVKADSIHSGIEQPVADFMASYTYDADQQNSHSFAYKDQQNGHSYGENSQQTTGERDLNSSQYWENLGWWYDSATGQWYQNETTASQEPVQEDKSQVGSEDMTSSLRSDVSYLQQTSQSVVEAVPDNVTMASVSNWNQTYEGTSQYPSHMLFDPQFPGYYYDTIKQEWFTLESYAAASQIENSGHANHATVATATSTSSYRKFGQAEEYISQGLGHQDQTGNWGSSGQGIGSWSDPASYYSHQNTWVPESGTNDASSNTGNNFNSTVDPNQYTSYQTGLKLDGADPLSRQVSHGYDWNNAATGFQSYSVSEKSYDSSQMSMQNNNLGQIPSNYYVNQNSAFPHQEFHAGSTAFTKASYSPVDGRSSAGRPPHALVSFGFGGKLIVMKYDNPYGTNAVYGSQGSAGASVSILNLLEVVLDKTDSVPAESSSCDHFRALCQQSFPGPLVGGSVATKDLNKWLDDRITNCSSTNGDLRKGELMRLLLSLLRISCQQYGKLRSPFGVDSSLQEPDGPEAAITKLFASAKRDAGRLNYGTFTHCMQNLPSESQMRTSAVEVQNLLVAGKRKEALQCAQEGQLWGPALVLAAIQGQQSYAKTVKQMAHSQFVLGSPLRTLCLLIAGEPADVFSGGTPVSGSHPNIVLSSQQPLQIGSNCMLDEWEENLAIMTANRTKGDELVIMHLGDCLWRERGEIMAVHTCYLVAEASFEPFSDSARLCLVGADHLKCPRTYATPEAIQRTEVYEYSKVLGNSQYVLPQFQPYKLIYAYMLAEVGKVSDSLRYCQAIMKTLKNSGRASEVETLKSLVSSLEERIRSQQQGGFNTNLAPGKLVGKLFTSIDKSISRMMGAPPPVPPTSNNTIQNNEPDYNAVVSKVSMSQSSVAMSTMIPSASMEPISAWAGDNSRMTFHNRSISEPDFSRSPKEVDQHKESGSGGKASVAGGQSRFGHFGSQLLQKTMGWVSRSRPDRQAKLGDANKFYYDEKLKRWVEEGVEPPAEEAALPPPPTTASFQNGRTDYNMGSAFKSQSPPANDGNPPMSLSSTEHSSGIPPMPPSSNQFSARSRMGVRSRYVDTFNKGGVTPTNLFQSPPVPAAKPMSGAKFFVPTPSALSDAASTETLVDGGTRDQPSHEDLPTSDTKVSSSSSSSQSLAPSHQSLAPSIPRFQSLDNVTSAQSQGAVRNGNGPIGPHSRAASWSGGYSDMLKNQHKMTTPSPFMPSNSTGMPPVSGSPLMNGGSFGDDLQDVDL